MKNTLIAFISALLTAALVTVTLPRTAFAGSVTSNYIISTAFQGPDAGFSGGYGYAALPSDAHLQSVAVTVADFRDGGSDVDQVGLCILRAWNRVPAAMNLVDAGRGLWSRLPDWDLYCPDAGVPLPNAVTMTKQATANVTSVWGDLYYSTEGVVNDAGLEFVHTILIRATF